MTNGLQQGKGERATSGGVDDEIGRKRLALAVGVLVPDRGDGRGIGRRHESLDTAALAHLDVGPLLHALPRDALDERAGHRVREPAEITLRKGIVTWALGADVETDP